MKPKEKVVFKVAENSKASVLWEISVVFTIILALLVWAVSI